jgi:uncharacterized SAM-binding protein YcdF (DUF218 family)
VTLTAREHFLIKLFTVQPSHADAIVCLCGEDSGPRLEKTAELFRAGYAALIVVSGGRDDQTRLVGAKWACAVLVGWGVPRDRIVLENESQHTADQSHNVTLLAVEYGWKRMLLVGSAYHLPRAFCTFDRAALGTDIEWIPSAAVAPWNECPAGMDLTRSELLDIDVGKCAQHIADVASWEQGLNALEGL